MNGICLCQVYRIPSKNREFICVGLEYSGGELKDAIFYENGQRFSKKVAEIIKLLSDGTIILHTAPWKK